MSQSFHSKFEEEYKKQGMDYSMADQEYPIAVVPKFVKDFKPGDENLFAGKGKYYLMTYGPYCIAMNCTSKKISFPLPDDFVGAEVLSDTSSKASAKYTLQGKETVVLHRKEK